jgi:cyclohexanone monooxygenase
MTNVQGQPQTADAKADFDAIIIGAGFSGMYMLPSLRDKLDLNVTVLEAGDGVGGT